MALGPEIRFASTPIAGRDFSEVSTDRWSEVVENFFGDESSEAALHSRATDRLVSFFSRKRQSCYVDFLIELCGCVWKEAWRGEISVENWESGFEEFVSCGAVDEIDLA